MCGNDQWWRSLLSCTATRRRPPGGEIGQDKSVPSAARIAKKYGFAALLLAWYSKPLLLRKLPDVKKEIRIKKRYCLSNAFFYFSKRRIRDSNGAKDNDVIPNLLVILRVEVPDSSNKFFQEYFSFVRPHLSITSSGSFNSSS